MKQAMLKKAVFIIATLLVFPLFQAGAADLPPRPKKVLLDNFYNHQLQKGKRFHYIWDDHAEGGYAKLGGLFVAEGAQIEHLTTAPTAAAQQQCSVYIIVNSNNKKRKSANNQPNYMTAEAVDIIVEWVKAGGVLALFNNDKGNADFEHVNMLAQKFGIVFNEDTRNKAPRHEKGQMQITVPPVSGGPILNDVSAVSMRGICTLSAQAPAKAILTAPKEAGDGNDVIMATSVLGKGRVFAVGDPWLYNEYLHTADNFKAAGNLVKWLLMNNQPATPGLASAASE